MLRELAACRAAAALHGVPVADLPEIEQAGRIAAWHAVRRHEGVHLHARAFFWVVGASAAARYHRDRRRARLDFLEPDQLEALAGKSASAEEVLLQHGAVAQIEGALAGLAARDPRLHAVLDAHVDGEPLPVVAVRLGIPENTARDRRRRARMAVGAALARAAKRGGRR